MNLPEKTVTPVSWHRAELRTESGDKLTAWVLRAGGRIILTCVSPNGTIEPVTKEDRRMVGEGVALMMLS
jgi:hypothetical protein